MFFFPFGGTCWILPDWYLGCTTMSIICAFLKTNDTIEVVGWVIFLGGDSSKQQSALYARVPLLGFLLLLLLLQTKPTMEKD
jgi:hypothetical protein